MNLRKHQNEFNGVVDDIIAGAQVKDVILSACPGAGKSAIPIIAGKLITSGMADALCWIAPRKSLQHQAESNFVDPFFRNLLGHTLTIRSSTNEPNPCRGLDGVVTTYQAVGVDEARTLLEDFRRRRYVLIMDEFHHIETDSLWHHALSPIYRRAKYRILMSGTLSRGDGTPIAFMPYAGSSADLANTETRRVIQYSRLDALAEKAIIPLHFRLFDAEARWMDEFGREIYYPSIAKAPKRDIGKAVYTAISTEFSEQLLSSGVDHWRRVRAHNPVARVLVVTAGIEHARKALEWMQMHGYRADIATSHDSPEAMAAIRRLKSGEIDILVGIGMFYEGFDCKEVSHMISLTHIRTDPWIIQMVSRAVRVQSELPYEWQYGYVFCPDDPNMRDIVARIEAEQLPWLKERAPKREGDLFGEDNGDPPIPQENIYGITPIGSSVLGGREYTLGAASPSEMPVPTIKTPTEIEAELRDTIERHVRQYAFLNRYKVARINAEIKRHIGVPRGELSIKGLERCLEHIRRAYPLNGSTPRKSGYSKPRGTGKRVPAKAVPWP